MRLRDVNKLLKKSLARASAEKHIGMTYVFFEFMNKNVLTLSSKKTFSARTERHKNRKQKRKDVLQVV